MALSGSFVLLSFVETLQVRVVRDALSSDMKTRLESFQARCQNLRGKFNNRIVIGMHKMLKDGKLGKRLTSSSVCLSWTLTEESIVTSAERHEKILQWLNAPDPSRNYNTAREKHREGTGSWFLAGNEFKNWKNSQGSLLWVEGIRAYL